MNVTGRKQLSRPSNSRLMRNVSDRVVEVVAERELGYAARADRVVERAAPHLCAQRAGVILLAHVKDYLLDVGFQAGVGNVQLLHISRTGVKSMPSKPSSIVIASSSKCLG